MRFIFGIRKLFLYALFAHLELDLDKLRSSYTASFCVSLTGLKSFDSVYASSSSVLWFLAMTAGDSDSSFSLV